MNKSKSKKLLAVIPARSKSQRLKDKNILNFFGTPLLGNAINIAKKSHLFDKIIVSTDSEKYIKIAKKYGAETPFVRPQNLSDNHTITVPVIRHAILELEKLGDFYDYVCCIFPCTPFLDVKTLKQYFNYIKKHNSNYCYPIKKFEHPIHKSIYINESFKPKYFFKNKELTRTQDLKNYYYDVGQFYWGKSSAWKRGLRMHTAGIAIPTNKDFIEIDDLNDLNLAKKKFNK